MLKGRPGPNEKAAQSYVDDGDDSLNVDELPINASGVDGKLPSGYVFVSIKRIRDTINRYVEEIQSVGWYANFKLPTVQALHCWLQNHHHGIMSCAHCDVQIGYKQVSARVCAMIELHKAISKWLSTHDDEELISMLKPFKLVKRYLGYKGLSAGEDTAILLFFAKNQEMCKKVEL